MCICQYILYRIIWIIYPNYEEKKDHLPDHSMSMIMKKCLKYWYVLSTEPIDANYEYLKHVWFRKWLLVWFLLFLYLILHLCTDSDSNLKKNNHTISWMKITQLKYICLSNQLFNQKQCIHSHYWHFKILLVSHCQ